MKFASALIVCSAWVWRECHSFVPHQSLNSFPNVHGSIQVKFVSISDETTAISSAGDEENAPTSTTPKLEYIGKERMLSLPFHTHEGVNEILRKTEEVLRALQDQADSLEAYESTALEADDQLTPGERIYANAYVDLAKVDVVGFDYDYTLVTYTEELLELIYEMALKRLVNQLNYPSEMLDGGLKFDPFFSIRGLAVDKETGWICHLSYTHKVSVAWEGREKLKTSRIYEEYRGKRALNPSDRRKRLKPLNDLFSMAECCLIADTIQFFKDHDIPYCPQNAATDVLSAIRETHISGDFHKIVAENPEKFFLPSPHLKEVLNNLKEAGKSLIFVR
jgi:5' nucleotidase family